MLITINTWAELTETKVDLLSMCGWGNFRKHLKSRKYMVAGDLTTAELAAYSEKYGNDVLTLINRLISHEINLYGLLQKYFKTMADYLTTGCHGLTLATSYSCKLWSDQCLQVLYPEGYRIHSYKDSACLRSSLIKGVNILLKNSKGGKSGHMMAIYWHPVMKQWFYIDPNGQPPDIDLEVDYICYPNHPVNAEIHGMGHCTAWTIFFIEILKTLDQPLDYTQIPKYVFITLFKNYCSSLPSRIPTFSVVS